MISKLEEKKNQKVKVKVVRVCVFISKMHGSGRILSTSLFFFSCFYLCQGLLYLLLLFLTTCPFMLIPLILCKWLTSPTNCWKYSQHEQFPSDHASGKWTFLSKNKNISSFFPWPIKIYCWTCSGPAILPLSSCFFLVCSAPPCQALFFWRDGHSVLQLVQIWLRATIHLYSCSAFGFQGLTENNWKRNDGYFEFNFFSAVDLVVIFQISVWGGGRIWKKCIFKQFHSVLWRVTTFWVVASEFGCQKI